MSQISKEAYKTFKNNASLSIVIGILAALVITAVSLLNFLTPVLGFIGFCLISIPMIFGCHLAYAALALGIDVKLSALFRYFRQYYSFSFSNCFRVLKCSLKALGVLVASLVTCGFIVSIILFKINPDGFVETINAFYDYYTLASDTYTYNEIMAMNGGLFTTFIMCSEIPSFIIATLFLAYKISSKSLNVYFRMNMPKFNPMIVKAIEDHFYSINKWKIKRDILGNNWSALVFALLFAAGGIVLGIFVINNPLYVANVAVSFIALSCIVFFPIYFYKMHGIYIKYDIDYKKSSLEISKRIYERIKNDYEMMGKEMEDKEEFEKVINDLEEESNSNNDENSSNE